MKYDDKQYPSGATPATPPAPVPRDIVQLLDDWLAEGGECDLNVILDRTYERTCHHEFRDDQGGDMELFMLLQTRYQHLAFT